MAKNKKELPSIEILNKFFDDKIRPSLMAHGGNVDLIKLENNFLFVRLLGGCQGCVGSGTTLKEVIRSMLKQNYPIIEDVIDVTEHELGKTPYLK